MARARQQTSALPASEAMVKRGRVRTVVTLVVLVVAVFLVLDGLVGGRGLVNNRQAQQLYEEESRALEQAREQNRRLREDIERIKTDPAAMEELIRRDLRWAKPGEKVFIVHDKVSDQKPQ